jgi:hypothetical protein
LDFVEAGGALEDDAVEGGGFFSASLRARMTSGRAATLRETAMTSGLFRKKRARCGTMLVMRRVLGCMGSAKSNCVGRSLRKSRST